MSNLAGIDEFLLTKNTRVGRVQKVFIPQDVLARVLTERATVSFSAGQFTVFLYSAVKLRKKVVHSKRKNAENYSDSIYP